MRLQAAPRGLTFIPATGSLEGVAKRSGMGWCGVLMLGAAVACGGSIDAGSRAGSTASQGGSDDAGTPPGGNGGRSGRGTGGETGTGGAPSAAGGAPFTPPGGAGGAHPAPGVGSGGTVVPSRDAGGPSHMDATADATADADAAGGSPSADAGGGGGCAELEAGDPCGAVVVQGIVRITTEADIAALSGVTRIEGGLDVDGFEGTSLAGLETLRCVASLTVRATPLLASLRGLQCLRQLGDINIIDNASLISLGALRSGQGSVANLKVENNPSLSSLVGLEGLTEINFLNIRHTPITSLVPIRNAPPTIVIQLTGTQLRDLQGLEGLTHLNSIFSIIGNPELMSLAGLESLVQTGWFFIGSNPKLPTCAALALRARISAGPSEFIQNNDDTGVCDASGTP